MHLYCILNTRNGKRYIGITTVAVETRWAGHVRAANAGSGRLLQRAIRKYGPEAFVIEHIASSSDWGDLCSMERLLIAQEGTMRPAGYNMTAGGEGMSGYSWTPEMRAAQAERRRGKPSTALHGVPLQEGHKRKLKDAWTPERRAAQAERMRKLQSGKKHSPEFVAKRNSWSPEKLSAARKKSAETRRRTKEQAAAIRQLEAMQPGVPN